MIRKRNVRTRVLLMLRQLGMLCKKPVEHKQRIRIQHTVYPEGYVNPLDSQRHVWLMNKKSILSGRERHFPNTFIETQLPKHLLNF